MEKMEIKTTNVRTDYEAETETGTASYGLRYTVDNGTLARVSATVAVKGSGTRGNLSYDRGAYAVGYFPYDGDVLGKVMEDFKAVVAAREEGAA